ncbi:hypothetical protein BSY238_1050 [Methyloversatilis sp. RAC08]|nr:hypothetical protein BSY238_1050 [Methyloversatilis sp. RAC08]
MHQAAGRPQRRVLLPEHQRLGEEIQVEGGGKREAQRHRLDAPAPLLGGVAVELFDHHRAEQAQPESARHQPHQRCGASRHQPGQRDVTHAARQHGDQYETDQPGRPLEQRRQWPAAFGVDDACGEEQQEKQCVQRVRRIDQRAQYRMAIQHAQCCQRAPCGARHHADAQQTGTRRLTRAHDQLQSEQDETDRRHAIGVQRERYWEGFHRRAGSERSDRCIVPAGRGRVTAGALLRAWRSFAPVQRAPSPVSTTRTVCSRTRNRGTGYGS